MHSRRESSIGVLSFRGDSLGSSRGARLRQTPRAAPSPVIEIDDVARFYQVYDAAGGHPTAEQLQHEYLDPGSEGLHHLAEARRVSGTSLGKNLTAHPEMYSDARRCMAVLPRVRTRLASRTPQIRPALS